KSGLLTIICAFLLTLARPVSAPAQTLARQFSTEIADVVEAVMPSVVVIRTGAVRYFRGYDWFYGRSVTIPQRQEGQGSGLVIDRQGHVLTSAHVIAGAQEIQVSFPDESTFVARLVAADPSTDLAVLRIEGLGDREVAPLEFADSDAVRVGEFAIAVGSPFSLQSSVTLGIVSQKGRSIGLLPYEDFIQTDAPINPGNSGGPLVDLDGKLIGINAVIHTAGTQGNIGIGFAIPSNLARRVADALIQNGKFDRPWIGVRTREPGPQTGRDREPEGLLIEEVYPNTPAARAKLQAGDRIVSGNGNRISTLRDLQRMVIEIPLGAAIRLEIQRERNRIRLEVPTENMPDFDTRRR
ncbi:MAG: trypsin-like peptidase domain-containing protein, partial [Kiritimatiellia bacterium]|nr:trypsin-like peptidase domain-containing protein [Kiritimatiellia bacterium]